MRRWKGRPTLLQALPVYLIHLRGLLEDWAGWAVWAVWASSVPRRFALRFWETKTTLLMYLSSSPISLGLEWIQVICKVGEKCQHEWMNEWMAIEKVKGQDKNLYNSFDESGHICKHSSGIWPLISSFKDSFANLSTEAEDSRIGESILDLNMSQDLPG